MLHVWCCLAKGIATSWPYMARALKNSACWNLKRCCSIMTFLAPRHNPGGLPSSTNMAILDLACGLHCWTHVHVQTPGQKADLLASASNERAHINREQSWAIVSNREQSWAYSKVDLKSKAQDLKRNVFGKYSNNIAIKKYERLWATVSNRE